MSIPNSDIYQELEQRVRMRQIDHDCLTAYMAIEDYDVDYAAAWLARLKAELEQDEAILRLITDEVKS